MYKGLPITTNKLPAHERNGVPHHLLDLVEHEQPTWTIRQFHERATHLIRDISSRGKIPVLVGGTHYYTQSVLFPKSLIESAEEATTYEDQQSEEERWPILGASSEEMLEYLRKVDPCMAQRWHPNDRRKIRRSLQVWLQTGTPASDIYEAQVNHKVEKSQDQVPAQPPHEPSMDYEPLVFWTHSNHEDLCARLDQRVDEMISEGLLDEVRSMHEHLQQIESRGVPVDQSRGIWIAIGFKEMLPYVSGQNTSDTSLVQSTELIKSATRQYAKRQSRWLRLTTLPAAQRAGLSSRFFLLDSTNRTQFLSNVEEKAMKIADAFLRGETLPTPDSVSPVASEILTTIAKKVENIARFCDVCEKTLMNEAQWAEHVHSKAHKRASRPKVDWRAMYPK